MFIGGRADRLTTGLNAMCLANLKVASGGCVSFYRATELSFDRTQVF